MDTIVELAQIMRDLSTLVVEQGTMLDRVDHSIAETAMRVRPCVWCCCFLGCEGTMLGRVDHSRAETAMRVGLCCARPLP